MAEPLFTTWSATSIDKILMPKGFKHKIIGGYVYHPKDAQSDHLPIIVDIKIVDKSSPKQSFTLVRFYKYSNIHKQWINY